MIYWLTQNLADVPEHDNWLTPGEHTRLDALRFPKRRADWRLGRWTGKLVVVAYFEHIAVMSTANSPFEHINNSLPKLREGQGGVTDFAFNENLTCKINFTQITPPEGGTTNVLAEIEIRAAADGAPEVFLHNEPVPAMLSISHSNGVAFCAAAPKGQVLGCDVEKVEPRSKAFVADYFTPAEMAFVQQASPENQPLLATLIWSAKESTLKALRQGLRLDTRSVDVQIQQWDDREKWNALFVRQVNASRTFQGGWRRCDGFVQTIVEAC